jgi:glycerol-3-phosphate O-acyltransferase
MRYYSNSVAHLFVLPSLVANRIRQGSMIGIESLADEIHALAPLLDAIYFCELAPNTERLIQILEIFDFKPAVDATNLTPDLGPIAQIIAPHLHRIALVCALLDIQPNLLDDLMPMNARLKALTSKTTAFNPEDLIVTEQLIQALSQPQSINQSIKAPNTQHKAPGIKPQAAILNLISAEDQLSLQKLALNLVEENIQSTATTS